jgi:hypothetical protein
VDQILVAADRAAEVTNSPLAFRRKQIMNSKPAIINSMIKRFEKSIPRLIGKETRTVCLRKI